MNKLKIIVCTGLLLILPVIAQAVTPITTRASKGAPLSYGEMDANLTNLRDATDTYAADLGAQVATIRSGQAAGMLGYATKAAMDADLAHVAGTTAIVTNDGTATNNTFWLKLGGSGSGSWQKSALPAQIPVVNASIYADFATAIAAQGSTPCQLVVSSAMSIAADTITPATIAISIINGGSISIPSGKTLTINGSFLADPYPVFTGGGSVLISSPRGTVPHIWFDHVTAVTNHPGVYVTKIDTSGAPVAAVYAVAGNLNGATQYSVTFISPAGETETSAGSNIVSPANQQVNLTNIPVSSDPTVTARKIYRKPVSAEDNVLHQYVATISDNTTTTYTDNISDGSLGVPAPRINQSGGNIFINGARVAAVGGISTSFGSNAMPGNTGYSNDAFGANALYNNTTGYRNTAIGVYSQFGNTTGARNVGMGVHSLNDNQTGDDNVAVGYAALGANTGDAQTAVGANALTVNTGSGNTAVGYNTLRFATTGSNNSGIGQYTLGSLVDGSSNSAQGHYAAGFLQHGTYNAVVGAQALMNATNTSSNTAVGALSLYSLTTGVSNIAIGNSAGYYETGDNKVFIDNRTRASEADARIKAPFFADIAATMDAQIVRLNGVIQLPYVPAYANNATAIANGLAVGSLYRTGANPDVLCIVH